jgi:CelD/BcsL family acetyltransferase involved in cellulose biosynthesis
MWANVYEKGEQQKVLAVFSWGAIVAISIINPHTDRRWCSFIASHEEATIFHHPSWLHVIESTYGYSPVCLANTRGENLIGILPLLEIRSWLTGKRAVCLPFSDVCTPLGETPEAVEELLAYCAKAQMQHGWKYVDVRGPAPYRSLVPLARFKTHVLSLQPESDRVFRTFKKTQIQQRITKSVRSGVTVDRRQDLEALKHFMRLNAVTRKKHGVPPQPDRFFLNLYDAVIAKGLGFVSIAMFEQKCIAASVFLSFNRCVIYKYSASDERFLSHRPNNLVVWDAIQWGCEHGYKLFDFGRTDVDNEGLLDYKRGWGTLESDLVYYRLSPAMSPAPAPRVGMIDRMKPVLRRMPVPVLKMIGRFFYAHVG